MINYLGEIQNLSGIVDMGKFSQNKFKQIGSGSGVVKDLNGHAPN